jgi:hypothetical protein
MVVMLTGAVVGNLYAVTISGKILDRETGESVPSAGISVVGTPRGAAADVEGLFSIPDLPAGKTELRISALGYQPQAQKLELVEGVDQHLTVRLMPEAVKMIEVTVETRETADREYTPKVAQYQMERRELSALPQLVEADLFRSLQVIPGVLPSSDFSADLNIWGGSSDQNLILLNGIEVYKPVHLGGLFSVFNMDAIKDVKLIKGGFGAKYGGRLSAVVDVADREGNRNRRVAKLGLSFLSANGTVEGPLPHGSYLLAGRRTYIDWASRTLKHNGIIEDDFPYYFYDLNVKVTRDFANGDRLSPSAFFGRDVLSLTSTSHDQVHLTWGNATYSVPFVHVWSHRLFSTNIVAGSFYDSDFGFQSAGNLIKYKNQIQDFTFKSDVTWFATARNTFDFGATAKGIRIVYFIGGPGDTLVDRSNRGWQYSGYLSDDFRPTENWTITPGIRVERNEIARATDWLPRLAIKRQLSEKTSLSAAWGLYSQYLQLVSMGGNLISIFDAYIPLDHTLSPNRGEQYALTFEGEAGEHFQISSDVYYKRFQRVIELRRNMTNSPDGQNANKPLSELFNVGSGRAFGMDLFLQADYGRFGFMAGYGLGTSLRSFNAYDGGLTFPAAFDRLHNTNVAVSQKIGKHSSLELRFNYGTGQPITQVMAYYYPGGAFGTLFLPDRRNGYRIPDYHRLDAAYRMRYAYRHWTLAPYLEVINVYNHKNVLTRDYDLSHSPPRINEITQLPILPSVGVNVEF